MDWLDRSITFASGVAVGVVGKYVGDILTDRRRKRESVSDEKATFLRLKETFPDLIREMRQDVIDNPASRRFFLKSKHATMGGSMSGYLYYHYEDHQNLDDNMLALENADFIRDIADPDSDLPRYAMSEQFVALLLESE